jgi:hypothetical protein
MTPEQWWKNFALGMEIDAAGTFVYNGIKALHELRSLNHPIDSFEVLYNLSVGIERLIKVAIILVEHHDQIDIGQFEESLISHNTIDLANRLDAKERLNLSGVHLEFLSLLSKFYKSHRYGRYSLSAIPDIDKEKYLFLEFIFKHLQIIKPSGYESYFIQNTDQIRKFVGKVVQKICHKVFGVVYKRAKELNIYTSEIRSASKALKVFYGERLDFINEELKKKEILLFLMNPNSQGAHIDFLRSFEALSLDPEMAPNYIQALLNDASLSFVEEEIDEMYRLEVTDVQQRFEILGIMDSELSYDEDEEAYDEDEEAYDEDEEA